MAEIWTAEEKENLLFTVHEMDKKLTVFLNQGTVDRVMLLAHDQAIKGNHKPGLQAEMLLVQERVKDLDDQEKAVLETEKRVQALEGRSRMVFGIMAGLWVLVSTVLGGILVRLAGEMTALSKLVTDLHP